MLEEGKGADRERCNRLIQSVKDADMKVLLQKFRCQPSSFRLQVTVMLKAGPQSSGKVPV